MQDVLSGENTDKRLKVEMLTRQSAILIYSLSFCPAVTGQNRVHYKAQSGVPVMNMVSITHDLSEKGNE